MKTGADMEAPAESDGGMDEHERRNGSPRQGAADPAGRAQTSGSTARRPQTQDPRARARAQARRRRRRRQRRIIIGTGILILVLIAGGIFWGVSSHNKKKARQAVFEEGITSMTNGDYEGAIAKFDEALAPAKGKVGKFESEVLQRRGDAEYEQGDYEAAKHTFEILEKDKSQEEYRQMLSVCEAKLGNFDAALAYGVKDAWVYNQMALADMEKQDYDAALGHIDQGIAAGDESVLPDLLYNQAVAYEQKGDFAKALELFETYLTNYGPDDKIEREVTFLKSRQGSDGDGA